MNNKTAEIQEIIKQRRSVYPELFTKEPIQKEELMLMLETANYAPTHKLTQPWRFVVISDEAKLGFAQLIADWYKANKPTEEYSELKYKKLLKRGTQSAYIVAIVMQRDALARIPEWEEIAATAMAVQNIWLTGASMGIGMFWSSPSIIDNPLLQDFLKLKEQQRCLGFLYMGRYAQDLELGSTRTPMEEKISWL